MVTTECDRDISLRLHLCEVLTGWVIYQAIGPNRYDFRTQSKALTHGRPRGNDDYNRFDRTAARVRAISGGSFVIRKRTWNLILSSVALGHTGDVHALALTWRTNASVVQCGRLLLHFASHYVPASHRNAWEGIIVPKSHSIALRCKQNNARVFRKRRLQQFHLVIQYSAVLQDEAFLVVRRVRQI